MAKTQTDAATKQWVVDYYHVSERLTTLAEALFGTGRQAWAWMRRMQKLLLKRIGGENRHERTESQDSDNRQTNHGAAFSISESPPGWLPNFL